MAMSLNELRAAFEAVIGRKTASKNKAWMRNRLAERGFAGGAPAAMVAEDAPAGSGQHAGAATAVSAAAAAAAEEEEMDTLASPRGACCGAPAEEA